MMYEYKMVQFPLVISFKDGQGAGRVDNMLQQLVDKYANDGWEFYRIDKFTLIEETSISQNLMGQHDTIYDVGVVSFRREKPTA